MWFPLELWRIIKNYIVDYIRAYHEQHAHHKGSNKEQINNNLNLSIDLLDNIIGNLLNEKVIKVENDLFSLMNFSIVLNDNETHEEIPTETPEDIWDLLQELKKIDEEENPD